MKKTALLMSAVLLLTACATEDPYTGEKRTNKTSIGAGLGALAGGVIGAATSGSKDRGKHALTGALAGAAIGGGLGYYMDEQDKILRRELQGTGVSVAKVGDQIILNMPGNITFKTGSADLSQSFFEVLDSVAKVMNKYDKTKIEVSGHTDNTGSRAGNMTLSYQRATAVAKYLQSQKVKASRFATEGYGPDYPVASNANAAGREQNRRVEIKLLPA
ncbi:MAG: OmpA family protein [Rickettsiales bacterium]|jgi:outer membrane protein OmpA-like peptidoglycan-associated protein|nr:OmpA family protein [Rickettsiales bacterium]